MSRDRSLQAFRQVWILHGHCWRWDRWRDREAELFVTRRAEIVVEEQVRGADESDPPADY